eukprot:4547759-Pyramimonas_sp.AAC.1
MQWGLSAELPRGYKTCDGVPRWRRRRHVRPPAGAFGGAPRGHETCEGCAEIEASVPCEPYHWGLRRSF